MRSPSTARHWVLRERTESHRRGHTILCSSLCNCAEGDCKTVTYMLLHHTYTHTHTHNYRDINKDKEKQTDRHIDRQTDRNRDIGIETDFRIWEDS